MTVEIKLMLPLSVLIPIALKWLQLAYNLVFQFSTLEHRFFFCQCNSYTLFHTMKHIICIQCSSNLYYSRPLANPHYCFPLLLNLNIFSVRCSYFQTSWKTRCIVQSSAQYEDLSDSMPFRNTPVLGSIKSIHHRRVLPYCSFLAYQKRYLL